MQFFYCIKRWQIPHGSEIHRVIRQKRKMKGCQSFYRSRARTPQSHSDQALLAKNCSHPVPVGTNTSEYSIYKLPDWVESSGNCTMKMKTLNQISAKHKSYIYIYIYIQKYLLSHQTINKAQISIKMSWLKWKIWFSSSHNSRTLWGKRTLNWIGFSCIA